MPIPAIPSELPALLRRLKLSPMLNTLPERLHAARQNKMPYGDLLVMLFCEEAERRDRNAAKNRADKAGLDPQMLMDNWDETAAVSFDRTLLHELMTLRFVEQHQHALVLGPVGVGKTFLGHAIGHIAVRRRMSVVCDTAHAMLHKLRAARLDNSQAAELRRLCTVDLLVIDDFAQRPMDSQQTADFFEIVSARDRKASMIVTSNREPEEWLPMMADPLLAQAAVDRLSNRAYDLIIEGESYRKRQKPQRAQ